MIDAEEVYILVGREFPTLVDFAFYRDKAVIEKRVDDLNELVKRKEYTYLTLYRSFREREKEEKTVEIG